MKEFRPLPNYLRISIDNRKETESQPTSPSERLFAYIERYLPEDAELTAARQAAIAHAGTVEFFSYVAIYQKLSERQVDNMKSGSREQDLIFHNLRSATLYGLVNSEVFEESLGDALEHTYQMGRDSIGVVVQTFF
jgi:hypothetical protein